MPSNKTLLIYFGITIIFLSIISCGKSQERSGQAVLHPIESNIPYHDRSHITISKNNKGDEENDQFGLKEYLQNPNNHPGANLDVLSVSPFELFIESIDESRIVILDAGSNAMFEYDIENHEVSEIAILGRGPGGISNARDLTISENMIYVTMMDLRISAFDCSLTPCSYIKEITLEEISPFSADVNGEQVAALGMKPVSGQTSGNDALQFIPVHLFDNDGKLLKSGGESYDTEGNWMLVRPFTDGIIRFLPENRGYIVAYQRLPYLYIYDTDMNLTESYKFEDFILGKQEYFPKEGRLRTVMTDYSFINNIYLHKQSNLIVEVETRQNMRISDNRYKWNRKSDFYRVYLDDKKYEYLGEFVFGKTDSRQAVLLTDHGIIEVNSDHLKWIELELIQNF
jgi:hypothetical protein